MIEEIHFKAVLTVIMMFFLAALFVLMPRTSKAVRAADALPVSPPGHQVIAYFFHGAYQ